MLADRAAVPDAAVVRIVPIWTVHTSACIIIANFILSLTGFPCLLPFHFVPVHRFLVSFFLYHLTLLHDSLF